jgi:phage protein D
MSDFSELARYADMHLSEYADQITNVTNSSKSAISPEMLQQRRNAYSERAKIAAVIRTIASDPALSAAVAEKMGVGG